MCRHTVDALYTGYLLGLGLLLCGCLLHALGAQTHVPGVGTLQTELVVRAALL